ncbi:major facilitator superfamily domain-containing protein [Zychaea mexicana]|uniref:major facilitator superfamily domain-containing protein n=1 Tax=Zychaea mexicana TaxID=64656 RepID=UPI0022FEA6E4|nr:major facilitator superfamily domain-containing protein [Zychaea mexicana]KAI9495831.1 major facilitator superfamily domain-containing protein [Zychaea mexicana]
MVESYLTLYHRAIAVSGLLANFVMFGVVSVWGVFSQAYSVSTLAGKATTLQLMGVGSLVGVVTNICSPVTILLVRFGTRFNYAFGSILSCLGLILAGFSTEVWHLYLSQGLLFGFGASLLYMSVASVIPQWFTKRRATAMGISSAGTGLGGLALSPMVSSLIIRFGIPWAYRILGLFSLGVCCLGTILIKDRYPSSHRKQMPIKSPIQLSMLKGIDFNVWLIGAVTALTGYVVPLFYLPKYAASIGINQTDSANLLAILCAMNAIGRIAFGYVGDKIGRLNMLVISSMFSGLVSFVVWPFATSYNVLLVYCILWGPLCGMYYGLAAPITASVVGMEKLGSGLSILFIVSAIAALGAPMAAAIQQAVPDNGYLGVQMFVGSVYVGGAFICLYLKYRLTRSLLAFC